RAVVERVQRALQSDVELDDVPVSAETSIGLAFWPTDAGTMAELLQCAELAMYTAKETHAEIVEYSAQLEHFTPARLALVSQLRRAIASDELRLHYQPKLDLRSGQVKGVEALVRWDHPERGLLPPAEFLDVAESTGLIGPLTSWVLDNTLAQLARWQRRGLELTVAVNVSARSLRDETLPELIFDRLAARGIQPRHLEIEITETALIADPARAITLLQRLRDGGVAVSLDDFGQGYTSLAQLGRLPLSELKIDRAFVATMLANTHDRTIVSTVIELGHSFGLRIVAEGAEDAETLTMLATLGCDAAQGYGLSRPLPPLDLETWMARYRPYAAQPIG
ncbi:MAG: EAL domain-containing protein, partial [Actinobacteria bacterium]|nr:EAL domain-containing protein [Actinomycetota bacterium]